MEDVSERSDLRRMQREQERERRRMRDRQRRQSMTLEQREKHLARRRRNYQLRRIRAESARSSSQTGTSIVTGVETIIGDDHKPEASVSGLSEKCNGVNHVGTSQGEEKLNVESVESEVLQALVHKSANFPRRLRLSQIRNFARSLGHSIGGLPGNYQMVAALITRDDTAGNCLQVGDSDSCRSPQSLRLNRVKRLARTLNNSENSGMKEAEGQNHQISKEDQKLPGGETRPVCDDTPKVL